MAIPDESFDEVVGNCGISYVGAEKGAADFVMPRVPFGAVRGRGVTEEGSAFGEWRHTILIEYRSANAIKPS